MKLDISHTSSAPFFSLITTTFNSEQTIAHTLQSALDQSFTNFEHIIIDNQSQDKTLEIIESYRPHYEEKGIVLRVFSQRDKGLYDGMNKGLQRAQGEIIGFLNSDDYFSSPHALSLIAWGFNKPNEDIHIIYANILYVKADLSPLRLLKGRAFSPLSFKLGYHPPHPSFYAKSSVYKAHGGFNLAYKIAADYEIMLRFLYKHKHKSLYIDECLVNMRCGGTSNASMANIIKANWQCAKAWRENELSCFPLFVLLKPLHKIKDMLLMKIKMINQPKA